MSRLKQILSASQFDRLLIEKLVHHARQKKYTHNMQGKILANMFFEPSTRTSSSFQAAMMKLGGNVLPFHPEHSSTQKKESLVDTLRVIEQYTDVTVLRHPNEKVFEKILPFLKNPIINAGNGGKEHPTQGLLDILTIHEELKRKNLDHLVITMVGDLKHGRTVHSLTKLLLNYEKIHFNFISPPNLQMPNSILEHFKKGDSTYQIEKDYKKHLLNSDVFYMTRIQQERFPNPQEYEEVANCYRLTLEDLKDYPNIVLHPLPRVNEICPQVDSHPAAKYFSQAKYGLYMRMSLLYSVFGFL